MIDVCLLGTSGTLPLKDRFLSSLALRTDGHCLLIDCGEGTQIAYRQSNFTFKHLDALLITHFHADHISGLPGLLLTMGNEGRDEPFLIAGPRGIEKVVNSLRVIAPELPFEINFLPLEYPEQNFAVAGFDINAFKVDHTVTCYGYALNLPRSGRFDPKKAAENSVPMKYWSTLQNGLTVSEGGVIYTPEMVLGEPRKGLKIVYCTDTRPLGIITEQAENSELFICEGMYGEDEKTDMADEKRHMTFCQAAGLAKKANVRELWLTHFSPSLHEPEEFIGSARGIFPQTRIGADGMSKTLRFDD